MIIDYEPTVTPDWVTRALGDEGIPKGANIGLYRIVSHETLPNDVWNGRLGSPIRSCTQSSGDVSVRTRQFNHSLKEIISRVTLGVMEGRLDLKLPSSTDPFWGGRIIRRLGFVNATRTARRFVNYMETLSHLDEAAWDTRAIWARVHADVKRDLASEIDRMPGFATIDFAAGKVSLVRPINDRLGELRAAIDALRTLLSLGRRATEENFHDLIVGAPILLEVYGKIQSKPRWAYADGESPLGKSYVEPDFVIRYSNSTYKLVEIERPDHKFVTRAGHPGVGVTHAAFQIAEWKDYIGRHYATLKAEYPNIANGYRTCVVVSRATQLATKLTDYSHYLSLARQQFGLDELWTWDDVLRRAETLLEQLVILRESVGASPGSSQTAG